MVGVSVEDCVHADSYRTLLGVKNPLRQNSEVVVAFCGGRFDIIINGNHLSWLSGPRQFALCGGIYCFEHITHFCFGCAILSVVDLYSLSESTPIANPCPSYPLSVGRGLVGSMMGGQ